MSIKLSHTAKEKIETCPAMYKYHYIDKLRSETIGSPLFFGSAIDEAISRVLLEKKVKKTKEEKILLKKDPYQVFFDAFKDINYNGEDICVAFSPKCEYSLSDFDINLLNDSYIASINSRFAENGEIDINYLEDFLNHIKLKKKLRKKLSKTDLSLFNYICYLTLCSKAKLLIDAFSSEIMPNILVVHSIQEKVTLPNENGDEIIGYIDAIVEFIDEPGVIYVVDIKTASKAYKPDSVKISPQLATYCEFKRTNKAAYIVLEKAIRKKDPKTRITIIKDEIPEETFQKTFDSYQESLYTIQEGEFKKNFDSGCFFFGKPCIYYQYCKFGKKDGLVERNDE